MKKASLFIVKVFLFFIGFFLSGRLFFLIYNYDKIQKNSISEILLSNIYGLPLDVSATGYFLLIILLLLILSSFFIQKILFQMINIFIISVLIICAFINVADSGLASTWGTKINAKAISYILYPNLLKDAIISVNYLVLIGFFILHSFVSIFIYLKYLKIRIPLSISYLKMLFYIPWLFIIFSCIRGGWGNNPIGKSQGVYCENPTLTLATVNGFWNLMSLYEKRNEKDYAYNYFNLSVAEQIKAGLAPLKDTTISFLKNNRPNIVIILTESLSAENMIRLGGIEDITPYLDSLSKEGMLFTKFYSNGCRTEQGMVAVLSGFPAQPKFSIQRESGKLFKLPMLSKILSANGYYLSFYYSNDLDYARTSEYLKIGLFNKTFSKNDFQNVKRTHSGAYDEYLFNFQIEDCKKNPFPFFSMFQTSSSHEPFDGDFEIISKGNKPVNKYINAIHYTDKCIGEYIKVAQKQSWFKNTLFIILADHGSSFPKNRDYNVPLRYQIPLIFYGDVIKDEFKGKTYNQPSSQIDIVTTVLKQLNINSSDFEFSKNLFNPYMYHYAYYVFDNGFGIIDQKNSMVFDHDKNSILYRDYAINKEDTVLLNNGKAILQIMMQRFIDME